MKKTTIKDIARIAGVSVATRERIKEIIKEENFVPSAFARGLVVNS